MAFLISSTLFIPLVKASDNNSTLFSNVCLSFSTSIDLYKLFGFNLEILLVNSTNISYLYQKMYELKDYFPHFKKFLNYEKYNTKDFQ